MKGEMLLPKGALAFSLVPARLRCYGGCKRNDANRG